MNASETYSTDGRVLGVDPRAMTSSRHPFSLRRAAATIFALSAILPLLVFFYFLRGSELVAETEVQIGLFVALVTALLGFLVFQGMMGRISKLARTVVDARPADLVAPPQAESPAVPGLGPVAEIGHIADAFSRMLVDLRGATDRLEDLVFKLSMLNEMVELVAKIPKIQDVLDLVLERTMRTVRASIGSIMLVDEERRTLRIAAARGLPEDVIANTEVGVGEGVAGKVALLGEPILVDDIEQDPRFAKSSDPKYGGSSFICMPVRVGGRIIGVINLSRKEYGAISPPDLRAFSPTDLQFLSALMAYIAAALDNARLLEEARQATLRLQQVVESQQLRLTLTQQQILQSEKLSALSRVVAGVAHELNNPLFIVKGQTDLLHQELEGRPAVERVDKIARAAERCARIVRSFLTLARQRTPERGQVRLNQVVHEAVEPMAASLRADDVQVVLDLADDLPDLWADPDQLHQVVVNLVTNAHHAMRETPPPRQLTLATWYDAEQERVSVAVADTGPGIRPEIRYRIFEPFFTTKASSEGTGLGLSVCHGIIEAHGGTITLDNRPEQGARFLVALPLGRALGATSQAGVAEPASPVRGRAVLVVDDEIEVAEVLAHMLLADGHQVERAANGNLALAQLRQRTYDVILCDIKMPELDGPGLYREVEHRYPGLQRRFIFLTGDTLSTDTQAFLGRIGAPCLSKPFTWAELQRLLQATLGNQS
ncbi:MAG: response regulator [Acidimicrobiia bacterium]|nr:response regulator [Acidimicrobiia bacterium]